MTKEEIFAAWAPDGSPWARWVKPVLFAHIDLAKESGSSAGTTGVVDWAPAANDKVTLVLDLPGAEGVTTGVALAKLGYHPVPLYNALPLPCLNPASDDITGAEIAAVEVLPILEALKLGAEELARVNLALDASPAFLLDANRSGEERMVKACDFDNRSISFASDFPSATFLGAQGIRRVLLVQRDRSEPRADLAHTLRRWQEGGLHLERIRLDGLAAPESFEVARPRWYGAMFQRVLASIGLRRVVGGGFGGWMPDSSAGG